MSDELLQIVGECAYVSQNTATGRAKVLLYKGSVVSADVPEAEHLLASGLVARLGNRAAVGVDAAGEPLVDPATAGTGTPAADNPDVKADAEAAAKREAARAKLPTGGSPPDGRAGQDVWVEYAVAQGMDRAEAEKASKADLTSALKK
jgi:hypothetical protein